jgi:hypothetical protein
MNQPKKPLTLTNEERRSPLWRKLSDHWKERLEVLHAQNEGDRSEQSTANIRGRIAECKSMLSLEKITQNID